MRRAPILTSALLAAVGWVLLAGTASAQAAGAPASEARGLRYLSWANRGEVAPATPAAAAPAPASPPRRGLRRPNTVIPHGGFATATPAPTRPGPTAAPGARRTLTPANAWMNRAVPPPEPMMAAPATPVPVAPRPAPALEPRATPDYLPDPGGRGQAVPADVIYAPTSLPAAAPAQSGPFDPMAPRRDAPIFRMQQGAVATAPAVTPLVQPVSAPVTATPQPRQAAEVSNSGERPPQQGGRYYSVHRQNGRQPDALDMPEPTYVDALAITMPETIASQDLAVPEQGPTLIRDAQGRVRPAPAASDGDHQ